MQISDLQQIFMDRKTTAEYALNAIGTLLEISDKKEKQLIDLKKENEEIKNKVKELEIKAAPKNVNQQKQADK